VKAKIAKLKSKLFKWLPFIPMFFRGVKAVGGFAANHAGRLKTLGAAGVLVAGAVTAYTVNGRINTERERNDAAELELAEIKRVGSLTADGLKEDLVEKTRDLSEQITAVSEEASAAFAAQATEIEQRNIENQEQLQTEINNVLNLMADFREVLESADAQNLATLQTSVVNLEQTLTTRVVVLETQSAAIPPPTEVSWVLDPSQVDLNYYQNCDDHPDLPNINELGLFIRGGDFTGSVIPDTTAPNGLSVVTPDHNPSNINVNTRQQGGNAGRNQSENVAQRQGVITGDAETAPVHLTLTCFVRIR